MTADSRHGRSDGSAGALASDHEALALLAALGSVADSRSQELALRLTRFFAVIATEVSKNPRFFDSVNYALQAQAGPDTPKVGAVRRSNRRSPGPLDPFLVFNEGGVDELRAELQKLDLEQLRDIISEHGMDNDRLAMKWKTQSRVIERIVDRVIARTAKGSAFK